MFSNDCLKHYNERNCKTQNDCLFFLGYILMSLQQQKINREYYGTGIRSTGKSAWCSIELKSRKDDFISISAILQTEQIKSINYLYKSNLKE